MIFGVGVLFSLYALSPFAADVKSQPFNRNFRFVNGLSQIADVDLKVNSFYIAGAANNTIYLGNYTGPFHLVQVSVPNLDTVHFNVNIDTTKVPDDYRVFRMVVDSPYFYLNHGTMPGLFKGSLATKTGHAFLPVDPPFFADALPLTTTRYALKCYSLERSENELATLVLDSPYLELKPNVLKKQIDGIFCVEGKMNYSKNLNRLTHVYSYRNECIVMDTNLEVVSRFHTIDTFRRAHIKVADVKSKNYSTLASPPAKINVNSCVDGNLLFVQSALLAENENKLEFQKGCTIDVYNIEKGTYLFSFHLPARNEHLPASFIRVGDYFAAIYDNHLILYELEIPTDEIQANLN